MAEPLLEWCAPIPCTPSQAQFAAVAAPKSDTGGAAAPEAVTRAAVAVVTQLVDGARLTPAQKMLRDELGFVAGAANIACVAEPVRF